MSPPESSHAGDVGEKSPPRSDISSSTQNEEDLGQALAGMSLHSEVSLHSQTSFGGGSSALANVIAKGSSTTTASQEETATISSSDGWANYNDTSAAAAGSHVFSGGASGMGATPGVNPEHNESLQRFLSLDPSQTLGDDVFKLSSHNLPSLNKYEEKSDAAFGMPPQSLAPGPSTGNPNVRRRSDSPLGTGTTNSSRSVSPYNSSVEINGGAGRTIQAYQPYENNGESMSRNHSMLGEDDRSSSGYNSLAHGHGSHPSLTTLESKSTYGKDRNFPGQNNSAGSGAIFDVSNRGVDPSQQQPQVLYMAVPSPDGRGQVLQPVQMVQLPGKPYTYVLPGNGMAPPPNGAYFPDQNNASAANGGNMMNLPSIVSPATSGDYMTSPDLRDNISMRPGYASSGSLRGSDDFNNGGRMVSGGSFGGAADPYATTPQRPPLETLLGQVRRLSRDQVGCRLVQQALDEEGPMAATLILNEGLSFWGEAMVDPFGNYLFQKILEKITAEERVMLVKSVSTRLVNASLNLHGTRSVQKVVELCAQDEQSGAAKDLEETSATILTAALQPAAARLCIDSHGNHVIQRILLKLGPKYSKFVFDAVAESVGDVARHRHGCCVIQRCLDSPPSEARSHLVGRIVDKALELMQDAYGNYVVQYVLDVCSDEDVHAVCESVVGKVNLLAIQKFSSNVMEKCLERCSDRVKECYLKELSEPDHIRELMMDPFGNYVVQRALSVATHAQAIGLVEAMRPHLIATQTLSGQRNGGVRNTAGGRRIIAKICRRFPNFTLSPIGSHDEIYSQNKGGRHQHHPQQQHLHSNQHRHHGHPGQAHHVNGHHHFNGHHLGGVAPVMQQHYAAVGGPTTTSGLFDPRLAPGHMASLDQQGMPSQQQQAFYGAMGGNPTAGYYDQFGSHGSYPGM